MGMALCGSGGATRQTAGWMLKLVVWQTDIDRRRFGEGILFVKLTEQNANLVLLDKNNRTLLDGPLSWRVVSLLLPFICSLMEKTKIPNKSSVQCRRLVILISGSKHSPNLFKLNPIKHLNLKSGIPVTTPSDNHLNHRVMRIRKWIRNQILWHDYYHHPPRVTIIEPERDMETYFYC